MRWYCERYIKNSLGGHTVFDAHSQVDFNQWWSSRFNDDIESTQRDPRSMLMVEGLQTVARGAPIEGNWYELGSSFLQSIDLRREPEGEGGSPVLRASGRYMGPEMNFAALKAPAPPPLPSPRAIASLSIEPNSIAIFNDGFKHGGSPITIHVRNVGHGNLNEVRIGQKRLLYDVGAELGWSEAKLCGLVKRLALSAEPDLHIVLSHWDVDHYQAVLGMSDADLRAIRSFHAPSQIPSTLTAGRVWAKLAAKGVSRRLVRPAVPVHGSRAIRLVRTAGNGCVEFFRATPGRSRNQTGIVLRVNGLCCFPPRG